MPTEPDPAEVAAQLRKLLDAAEDGRLVAASGPDRRLVALMEGAVAALEEAAKRSKNRKKPAR